MKVSMFDYNGETIDVDTMHGPREAVLRDTKSFHTSIVRCSERRNSAVYGQVWVEGAFTAAIVTWEGESPDERVALMSHIIDLCKLRFGGVSP